MASYQADMNDITTLRLEVDKVGLIQQQGEPASVSDYGVTYQTVRVVGTMNQCVSYLIRCLEDIKRKGATDIIWRIRPEAGKFESGRKFKSYVFARFHVLPVELNDQLIHTVTDVLQPKVLA